MQHLNGIWSSVETKQNMVHFLQFWRFKTGKDQEFHAFHSLQSFGLLWTILISFKIDHESIWKLSRVYVKSINFS